MMTKVRRMAVFCALCLFCATIAGGQEPTHRFYTFASFAGGLNSQVSKWIVKRDQATVAQNVRFNLTYGGVGKRSVMVSYGDAGSAAVKGAHRYYSSDGTQKLIVATGEDLEAGNDDAGTFQVIDTDLTDGKRWQFVTYQDIAIGMNGYDNAKKYDGKILITDDTDGARTAENLCAELGAPFAELNTGANLDASSWYMYKVAFYDGTTYTYSTARSNAIKTGATVRDITLTDIPIGPSGTTHRYVYRTLGNASRANALADTTYYRVADIADNSTRTLNDAVDDATASGDAAPTWGTVSGGSDVTPPKGRLCTIHGERLFIAGNLTYPSDLYYSDEYNPDFFAPTGYEPIRADDGDTITFIKDQLGVLTVGKTNTIQKYYTSTSSPSGWYPSDPYSHIGCVAPYSATNTPLGIVYLATSGLYAFNGQTSTLISDAVTPQIRDINPLTWGDVVGVFCGTEYQLSYTSNESGDTANNRVLIFDVVRNAYALDYKNIDSYCVMGGGSDTGILYSGSSGTDGTVYAHEYGESILAKRYASEFNAGTFTTARVYNTEKNPIMEIAWTITIDEAVGTIDTHAYGADAIIDRPATSGTWVSPTYYLNASSLDKLYWNESLGSTGDVTFQIRTGATAGACAVAAWSAAFTDPNGSDISGLTANVYLQVKINLTTSNILYSPELYVSNGYLFRITYLKAGSTYESDFLSEWQSGWNDFDLPGYRKLIERIKVFYIADEGTMTVGYMNERGDLSHTFDIDMSINPDDEEDDDYTGVDGYKVYTYAPPIGEDDPPSSLGQMFRFTLSETGSAPWVVGKIEVMFRIDEEEVY